MAIYTVITGPNEELLLDFMLERLNAWRAAADPPLPPLTKDQLVGLLFHTKLQERWEAITKDDETRIDNGVDEATESQKAQIRTILGLP